VDVGGDGDVHPVDPHGGRLIEEVGWVLIGASGLLSGALGQPGADCAEFAVGGGAVAVLLDPVHAGSVDVINPYDVGGTIGTHVEHGPWGGADDLSIRTGP
jgi:hypothetical protein